MRSGSDSKDVIEGKFEIFHFNALDPIAVIDKQQGIAGRFRDLYKIIEKLLIHHFLL